MPTGLDGAIWVTSVRMRREDRSSISSYSSRRPRLETVDRVTSSLAPHTAQFLCSSQGPFLRPGPQNVDRVARRGGQGRPSRLACGGLPPCPAPAWTRPAPPQGSAGREPASAGLVRSERRPFVHH